MEENNLNRFYELWRRLTSCDWYADHFVVAAALLDYMNYEGEKLRFMNFGGE